MARVVRMTHKQKNFSGRMVGAFDGDEFIDCNLSQDTPSTVISTAKNLVFRGCNLARCHIDPTWDVREDNNTANFPKEPEVVVDPIDEEIKDVVRKMDELATAHPDKVSKELKAAVSKEKTQGLLSADGAPVTIEAPEGWKK
jgi:hypothetical protein